MSLTREEWIDMWGSIRVIEECAKQFLGDRPRRAYIILTEVDNIKKQIQQVIGQQEAK